jgi:hypothetical protein
VATTIEGLLRKSRKTLLRLGHLVDDFQRPIFNRNVCKAFNMLPPYVMTYEIRILINPIKRKFPFTIENSAWKFPSFRPDSYDVRHMYMPNTHYQKLPKVFALPTQIPLVSIQTDLDKDR